MTRRDAMLFASAITACQCLGCNSSTPSPTPPDADAIRNSELLMNRIVFPGNPWPNGHAIKELIWSARLDPENGLWFDLHLESDDYYAEDEDEEGEEEEDEDASDWESKIVWSNYHSCILSSTYWGHRGFLAATKDRPLDFSSLGERSFKLDPLPPPDEVFDRAFGIYLLGHDGAADHHIRFTPQGSTSNYLLDWRGKIALEYAGSDVFEYAFHATYDHLAFEGIRLPDGASETDAMALLNSLVDNIGQLKARRKDDSLWLTPQ